MTSELTLHIASKPTTATAEPAPAANNNSGIGLGTANLKNDVLAELGTTDITVNAVSYTEPAKPWNTSNSQTTLTIKATFLGINIDAAATVRKIGTKAYLLLEKLDGYEGLDVSKIKGKWISADSQDTASLGTNSNINAGQYDAYIRDLERFVAIAGQKKAIVIQPQGTETITGVKTKKYQATIAPDKLAVSLEQLINEKKKRGEDTKNYDSLLKSFQDAKNQTSINDFFKQLSFEVWVDVKTKLPRKITLRMGTLPMETAESTGLNMVTEYTFAVLTTNQTQTVETPTDTMTLADAFGVAFEPSPIIDDSTAVDNVAPTNTNANTNTVDTTDSDQDGLTDVAEKTIYQTNPNKADTDDDTYSDKTEIDGGYNPNGQGKATAEQLLLWGSDTTVSSSTNTNTSPIDSLANASLANARAKARDAQRKSDVAMMRSGLALYNDDHGAYPASLSVLVPVYIDKLPTDPTTNMNYGYQICAGNHYLLSTSLETTTNKFYADDGLLMKESVTTLPCGQT
jgi:hypothetical protein